ncbi:MAG: DUF2799 domain-containing protein [Pseudomonadota bacterium]
MSVVCGVGRIGAVAGCLLLAGSCTTLNKQECAQGDWYGIGYRDGLNGRDITFVDLHGEACARIDIAPDVTLWREGRQAGLKVYCTPRSAFRVAAGGGRFHPVCTPDLIADPATLEEARQAGERLYRIERDLSDAHTDLAEVRQSKLDLEAAGPDEETADERLRLERKERRLENEIDRLKRARDRAADREPEA